MEKCPECKKQHKKKEIAERCYSPLSTAYGHYLIIFGRKEGPVEITEEKCIERKVSWDYYQEILLRRREMKKYLSTF